MKREDWQAAYEPIPAALHTRVSSTLSQLDKEEKVMKRTIIRTLALALCAALLRGRFEKIAAAYPYQGDIEQERSLLALTDGKIQNIG